MKTSRRHTFLNWLEIDPKRPTPLYAQVSNQIRDAVIRGDLEQRAKLPASRQLARELIVSRTTTLQAYALLQAEGFVETRHETGTFVAPDLTATRRPAQPEVPPKPQCLVKAAPKYVQTNFGQAESSHVAFQPGVPAFDAFPHALWSRLLARSASRDSRFLLDYAYSQRHSLPEQPFVELRVVTGFLGHNVVESFEGLFEHNVILFFLRITLGVSRLP